MQQACEKSETACWYHFFAISTLHYSCMWSASMHQSINHNARLAVPIANQTQAINTRLLITLKAGV